jgi:hypothetical protein
MVARDRQRNRGFFSGMARGVSRAREGSKILTFLFGPRLVCTARSYVSEARGRRILRTTSPVRCSPKFDKIDSAVPYNGSWHHAYGGK